jgi:hypothetical protein
MSKIIRYKPEYVTCTNFYYQHFTVCCMSGIRLPGPHRYHQGIVQQAQGRSAETAVSPHHKNQSTIYNDYNNFSKLRRI